MKQVENAARAARRRYLMVTLSALLVVGSSWAPSWATKPDATADHKTLICHATGSDVNPYVVIEVDDAALDAHRAHQDGRDIIPAPDGVRRGPKAAAELCVPPTTTSSTTTTTTMVGG